MRQKHVVDINIPLCVGMIEGNIAQRSQLDLLPTCWDDWVYYFKHDLIYRYSPYTMGMVGTLAALVATG